MKTTLSTSDIAHALKSDENAAWTWNGARALAEYLEEYEEETGEEMELDVVAIRCDFSEYSSLDDWAREYFSASIWEEELDIESDDDDDAVADKIREYIQDHGTVIEFDGGIIVSSF